MIGGAAALFLVPLRPELAAKLLGIASRTIYRKLKEREDAQTGETA